MIGLTSCQCASGNWQLRLSICCWFKSKEYTQSAIGVMPPA